MEKQEQVIQTSSFEENEKYFDEKKDDVSAKSLKNIDNIDFESEDIDVNIVNQIAFTEDDPTMRVITIRSVVVGCLLGCLGASIRQLMLFKPAGTSLSDLFMLIVGYLVCVGSTRMFKEGTLLNPCPFNVKEHTMMYIIISSANSSAYGTYILGAQALYYTSSPSAAGGIFLLLATQLVGYGIAGQLRPFLVYPSLAIWPTSLPTVSFLRTFNTPGSDERLLIRFFFSVFFAIFVWELFPQYIFPVLSAISVVCLAKRDSPWVQRLFGGVGVNEGLGIGSISLDWSYLSSLSPLVFPLYVQLNINTGIALMWIIAPLTYYYNVWDAQKFPFLSSGLFKVDPETGIGSKYPQTLILDEFNNINQTALEEVGHPHFGTVSAIGYVVNNIGVTASLVHIFLYYGSDIKKNALAIFRRKENRENDIHNRLMAAYKEVPTWWYYAIFIGGVGLNIGIGYANHSQLPWWGFIFALFLATALSLPMNMIQAITGTGFGLNIVAEMICGFILPGKPVANMYFKTLGVNTVSQAGFMANDLKIGHYLKVPPRVVFSAQIIGTIIGSIFNYIINYTIIDTKREELLEANGRIWSGSNMQVMNAAGITWGGLGPMVMFGPSTQYYIILWAFVIGFAVPIPFWLLHRYFPKVGFNLVNTPMILYGLALFPNNNYSWVTCGLILALVSQLYVKRRYSKWYVKHNYLMSAALDSGTSFMSFILAMSVFGGADGVQRPFPIWGGNPDLSYVDYCCADCE